MEKNEVKTTIEDVETQDVETTEVAVVEQETLGQKITKGIKAHGKSLLTIAGVIGAGILGYALAAHRGSDDDDDDEYVYIGDDDYEVVDDSDDDE